MKRTLVQLESSVTERGFGNSNQLGKLREMLKSNLNRDDENLNKKDLKRVASNLMFQRKVQKVSIEW